MNKNVVFEIAVLILKSISITDIARVLGVSVSEIKEVEKLIIELQNEQFVEK